MINQTKFILKLALMLMLFSLHVVAFDTFIQSAYKQNNELNQLKKQYKLLQTKKQKNELESALAYGHNKKMSLHVSILEKQKSITLGTLIRYFTVLANKRISLLYDENNQIQNYKYNKALNDFKNYTGLDFKNTNIEKLISNVTLPPNSNAAYQVFMKLSIEEKSAISTIFKIDNEAKVFTYLRSSYNQYINMLNSLKISIDKINKAKEQSDKEKLIVARIKYIQQSYKILFQKSKILFIIGTLETELSKSISAKKIKNTKLKRIHFIGNSSEISSYSINIVERHAKKLLKIQNFTLELHGYSDSFGNKKDNYRLSKERVEKTKEALVKFGLNPEKIKLFYYGDKNPIKTNETEQGRLLNRRVEFKIIKDEK